MEEALPYMKINQYLLFMQDRLLKESKPIQKPFT